ncbi:hypothetical protein ACJX0J_029420 [Zea mays]
MLMHAMWWSITSELNIITAGGLFILALVCRYIYIGWQIVRRWDFSITNNKQAGWGIYSTSIEDKEPGLTLLEIYSKKEDEFAALNIFLHLFFLLKILAVALSILNEWRFKSGYYITGPEDYYFPLSPLPILSYSVRLIHIIIHACVRRFLCIRICLNRYGRRLNNHHTKTYLCAHLWIQLDEQDHVTHDFNSTTIDDNGIRENISLAMWRKCLAVLITECVMLLHMTTC